MTENWQVFHTYVKDSDDKVDQISIDEQNRRYVLDRNVSDLVIDSESEGGNCINSIDVSRFVFEIIVEAVREKRFKELKE